MQHFANVPRGFRNVLEPQIGWCEAQSENVGIAVITDDTACNQRLASGVGFRVAKAELTAAIGAVERADAIEIELTGIGDV